ncbi:MAG: hypothetical protein ABIR30_11505 [Chitinophagaceae bacterium]
MNRTTILLVLLSYCFNSVAQLPQVKITSDIKKISGDFLVDYKNIKGALLSDDPYETVYYSRLKLAGSIDSSNLLHFSKESQFWKFSAEIDKEKMTIEELQSAILSINYSFGKIKRIESGAEWVSVYVPENKKGLTGKIRSFFIFILNAAKNPNDPTGGKLSFTLGQEDYYMNK